jgi:hypothetical protein
MKPEREADRPDLATLAKRFIDLWQDQMTALAGDPELADNIARFLGAMPSGMPFWPHSHEAGQARAQAAAAAFDERHRGVDELASRLRDVEERLARLEAGTSRKRGATPSKPRKHRA